MLILNLAIICSVTRIFCAYHDFQVFTMICYLYVNCNLFDHSQFTLQTYLSGIWEFLFFVWFRSSSCGCVLLAFSALDHVPQLPNCPAADCWIGALYYFCGLFLGHDHNFPSRAQRHHQKAARAGGAELGQKQGDNETVRNTRTKIFNAPYTIWISIIMHVHKIF